MPTKYRSEPRKPWKKVTTVRSLYMPELPSYKTEFRYGTGSYSEAFNLDNPTLKDSYPTYDADLGDRPPITTGDRPSTRT
jgi:hypothetical protein